MMSKTQNLRLILANSNRSCLFRRSYQTLSAVKTDLEQQYCQKKGHQVKPSYVRDLIKNLRDTNEFSKALEASEWMCEQKVFNVFPEDYAARFHLIETVLGLQEAEKFFNSIPENMRDSSLYDILLRSYTRSEKTLDKAEETFEKMRDVGFLSKPSPFNSMISLYGKLEKQDMVEKLQRELKEKNMEIDDPESNVLIKMEEMRQKFKTLSGGSIEKEIEMYGNVAGSQREVYRLWDELKKEKGRVNDDEYRIVISTLLKLDDVQGAEKIYRKWKPILEEKIDMSIPKLLISRFEEEGNNAKVEELVKLTRKKKCMAHFKISRMILPTPMLITLISISKEDPTVWTIFLWSHLLVLDPASFPMLCAYVYFNH